MLLVSRPICSIQMFKNLNALLSQKKTLLFTLKIPFLPVALNLGYKVLATLESDLHLYAAIASKDDFDFVAMTT